MIGFIVYLHNLQISLKSELDREDIQKYFHNNYPFVAKDNYDNTVLINPSQIPVLRILDNYDPLIEKSSDKKGR